MSSQLIACSLWGGYLHHLGPLHGAQKGWYSAAYPAVLIGPVSVGDRT